MVITHKTTYQKLYLELSRLTPAPTREDIRQQYELCHPRATLRNEYYTPPAPAPAAPVSLVFRPPDYCPRPKGGVSLFSHSRAREQETQIYSRADEN